MTPRQKRIIANLKNTGPATTAELVEWCECERDDALITLGLMVLVGQLFRVGWTKTDGVRNGVAIWGLDPPGTTELPYNRNLRTGE